MNNKLCTTIQTALHNLNIKTNQEIVVEKPNNKANGDYSTNIAMRLAKELKNNPFDIATTIAEKINETYIKEIKVEKPGFINFYLDEKYLLDNIIRINNDNNFGELEKKNEKINVEFVSANPTGLLHVGHARGACYGDALCRILSKAGYDVTREYYVNDGGNQINNLGISIKERYKEICGLDCNLGEDCYHGKEIIDIAKELYEQNQDRLLDKDIDYFCSIGVEKLLSKIKEDLKNINVTFDVWTSEKKIREKGMVERALEKLKNNNYTYEQDGALWLKTTSLYDDKDRVLIKSDGTYTYFTPDIAYHLDKIERGYDRLIDILGADHHGYVPRLKSAVEMLGKKANSIEAEIVQMVRFVRGEEIVKFSKRTGNAITIEELVDEVGKSAVRYFFVMRSLDTQMDFDLELAKKTSNENPVYYVEYAHARCASILSEASKKGLTISNKFNKINIESSSELLSKIYEFENTLLNAAEKRSPHILTNYVYELASIFHSYYAKEKIIDDDIELTQERLSIISACKKTISESLSLLGIEARERM